MTVEDTSKRPAALHLLGMMGYRSGDYIEEMEAAGQTQLVNSAQLPTDLNGGKRDDYLALGFTLGEPNPADPMFCEATLPAGWSRKGSEHAMWSHIVDERGLERVSIFYKAAFYDRSAHMGINNVGYSLFSKAAYGGTPIPWGILTSEETEQAILAIRKHQADLERHPDIYGRVGGAERCQALVDSIPS